VRAALAEMRTLLFELRPKALEAAPLGTLLERLGDSLAGQAQIPVDVDIVSEPGLPPGVKIALYRVAQEAFSNIAKHARASRVSATLESSEDQVTLAVIDDGRGFDPKAVAPERMGLRIMRERLDDIGASLQVRVDPGGGTTVVAVWTRPIATESGQPADAQPEVEQVQYAELREEARE
jgi:signal transduction histidine kinase